MFTMDMPYPPDQQVPVVLVADRSAASGKSTKRYDFILNDCRPVSSWDEEPDSGERYIDPVGMLINYMNNNRQSGAGIDLYKDRALFRNLTLIESVKHGSIVAVEEKFKGAEDFEYFHYNPILDYKGQDSASFMVEFEGKQYKIAVDLLVEPSVGNTSFENCPKPKLIKVNKKSISDASGIEDYANPASWYRAASLQALLSGATDALAGFADLPGGTQE